MAKNSDTGLFQLQNGNWGFRVTQLKDGKRKDTTYRRDENGNPFTRKIDAKKAREQKLYEMRNPPASDAPCDDCTLQEMWDYYIKNVAPSKRPSTVRKYSSLWEQHIKSRFGDKLLSEITKGDIEAYLSELYNKPHIDKKYGKEIYYSYKYVEGFVKIFFQLFGIAYNLEKIDPDRYNRMFLIQGSKIQMPKMRQSDAEEYDKLIVFNSYEISQMNEILKDTDLYTAFLFGYMCGLRISEVFGLRWQDYNWDTRMLTVNKQLNINDGILSIGPVKTLKSSRTIQVPDFLHDHLILKIREQHRHPLPAFEINASEVVLDMTDEKCTVENAPRIVGGDFINRRKTGELLTQYSMSYYSKKFKAMGINFHFHSLRKTHLTQLANSNCPMIEVQLRAGHVKSETTLKYYITSTSESRRKLEYAINQISLDEMDVEVSDGQGGTRIVKEHVADQLKDIASKIPH